MGLGETSVNITDGWVKEFDDSSRALAPSAHFPEVRKSPEHPHLVPEVPGQLPVGKGRWLWELGLAA